MPHSPVIPVNLELVAPTKDAPLHVHDCSCCQFLGRFEGKHGPADLYVHADGHFPTVISRFGSDGPEYSSGSCFSYGVIPDLTEARRRAQVLGILAYDVYEALRHTSRFCAQSMAELRAALPFTVEYQTVLAFEAENFERSYGLMSYLIAKATARERKYRPDATAGSGILAAEDLLRQVVWAYRGSGLLSSVTHLDEIAKFAWDELPLTEVSDFSETA